MFWTFFIFLVMSKVSKNYPFKLCVHGAHLQFYCQMLHFNDSIEWESHGSHLVCNWSSIFTQKQKDIKYAKIYPKWELNTWIISIACLLHLLDQYLDATHCNGFCEELLQTGCNHQVWNPIDFYTNHWSLQNQSNLHNSGLL